MTGFDIIFPEGLTKKEQRVIELAVEISSRNWNGTFTLEDITNEYYIKYNDKKTENAMSSMAKALREIAIKMESCNTIKICRKSPIGRGFVGLYGWELVNKIDSCELKRVKVTISPNNFPAAL